MTSNEANSSAKHWAVLIGINFYVNDRCLRGSVRDVEMIIQYLEAGTTPVDVALLTATTPSESGVTRPVEKPSLWPTRINVVSTLMRVISQAKRGDFVYIHYSGHGTRRPDSPVAHKKSGSLAFVLFEDNEHGCSYLRGIELATCLQKMVMKGFLVTLVLDCCYSGSVLRYSKLVGADIRATDYNPAVDAVSPHSPDMDSDTGSGAGFSDSDNPLRNSHIPQDQWLVDPDGYTILSACGPHEKAWELEIDGDRRGALTNFLFHALSALRKRAVELTHQSLYQHLRTRFHASWPQQTPMRYGNENFSFFGKLGVASETGLVSVYRTENGRLCLTAGEAHGVCKGDEYAVYPFETPEGVTKQIHEESVMVTVDTVRCLTSDVVEIRSLPDTKHIKTGWKARPVTYFSPRKISMQLMASVVNQSQVIEAGKQRPFLRLSTENDGAEPCIFKVNLNKHMEYEVLDGSDEGIISLPTIPVDTDGALDKVIDVLQHLATFKYFEAVDNRTPSPHFEQLFSLLPTGDAGETGIFDVKHGDIWSFTLKNNSDKPLYLAIFNFIPSWQIVNLMSLAGGGDFLVILPKDEELLKLRMEVPDFLRHRNRNQSEDIVKAFITSKATSFPSMILPDMPLHVKDLGGRVRGGGDQLSRFLSELTISLRNRDYGVHEEWATRNFIIRVSSE